MKFIVQRDIYTPVSTSGRIFMDGFAPGCTLELPKKDGLPGSCIPAGVYKVELYNSPHFGRIMPLITGIPGRSEIEIHWGDFPDNTRGCILVGKTRTPDAIWQTVAKFNELFPAIQKAVLGEGCWIDVRDANAQ